MEIANPLYDLAFKYLMSDQVLGKKVLSIILNTEVIALDLQPQEVITPSKEKPDLIIYRLDFKAIIKNRDGHQQLVLIELQKANLATTAGRFRNYLGHSYLQEAKGNYETKIRAGVLLPNSNYLHSGLQFARFTHFGHPG
ncbi:MAG: hypothetical protein HC821_00200 [Lewinella sp.]|nr:hypothetical protein [Lewinella sp.]